MFQYSRNIKRRQNEEGKQDRIKKRTLALERFIQALASSVEQA